MDTRTDDEYFNRYNELLAFISRAYYDIYVLEEFDRVNSLIQSGEKAFYSGTHQLLEQLCRLVKEDLALIICKVYSDQAKADHTVNTLKLFNNFIQTRYSKTEIVLPRQKMSLSKESESILPKIIDMRNQYLAHIESKRVHSSISINAMKIIISELQTMLNALCIPEMDSRAQ